MNSWDLVILAIIALSLMWGLYRGLVLMVGGLIVGGAAGYFGIVISQSISSMLAISNELIAGRVATILFWVTFVILFAIGHLLMKLINALTEVPIVGGLKHAGGGVLGLIQGVIVAGFVTIMAVNYQIVGGQDASLDESTLAPVVLRITAFILPLIATGLKDAVNLFLTHN